MAENKLMNTDHVFTPTGTSVLPSWVAKAGFVMRFLSFFFPSLVARFMAIIWFKPFMPKPKKHILEWQDSADKEIDLNAGQAFLFQGNATLAAEQPLVVCVHGWRGRAHQMRRFLPELLALNFRVVMVNLPAHSGQGKNHTDIYECANAITKIHKEIGPIDSIITHSFGSPVAALALSEDLQVRKFTMIAPNLNFTYLLNEYANAFGLRRLIPKIEHYIRMYCDKELFSGAWDKLNIHTLEQKLRYVQEVKIWHDKFDKEISIETNLAIHKILQNRQQSSEVIDVQDVGHFDILKNNETIQQVCADLMISKKKPVLLE